MKLSSLFMCIAGMIASGNALASSELMSCSHYASTWIDCKVSTGVISAAAPWHADTTFEFNFSCGPGWDDLLSIGVVASDSHDFKIMALGKNGRVTLSGAGPFELVDRTPDVTSGFQFDPGCSLKVDLGSSVPSDWQKAQWLSQRASIKDKLSVAETGRDGLAALLLYKEAFQFVSVISQRVLADLSKELELRKTIAEGTPLRNLLEQVVFETVEIPTGNGRETRPITRDEKMVFKKVVDFFDSLPSLESCSGGDTSQCSERKLEDFLSQSDKLESRTFTPPEAAMASADASF